MVERLIIEGTADTKNGNLREGFNKLLRKKLGRNMPRIVMGDGKSQAIDKFFNSSNSVLLCDLDGPDETREKDIQMHRFEEYRDSIYYMVQEWKPGLFPNPIFSINSIKPISQKKSQRNTQANLKIPMKNYRSGHGTRKRASTTK